MTRKFCIVGHPLKHTMSPPIHQKLFELSGKPAEYEILDVSPENLLGSVDFLRSLSGYNITIPHKIDIIPTLDKIDETAQRYGAVNCVHNANGVATGYNTDVFGFIHSLKVGGGKLGGDVLLIGSGGVGRMMAIEACLAGSALTIAVLERTIPVAEKVVADIKALCPDAKVKVTTLSNISGHYDLLINSTPVGMYPKSDACPISDEVISECDCIFDAIYNPVETLLINKGKQMGKKIIGGMAMLVWQAVVAHKIWDNAEYSDADIAKLIADMEVIVERDFK